MRGKPWTGDGLPLAKLPLVDPIGNFLKSGSSVTASVEKDIQY
jgi:hypothetical protein